MKKRKSSIQWLSAMISVAIVTVILVLGSAKAVTLGLTNLSDSSPVEGNTVTFTAYADIATNERIPISNLTLTIGTGSCTFYPNGTEISGTLCSSVTITLNETGGYDYGYRWGYDEVNGSNHTFGYGYGSTNSVAGPSYIITWTTPSVSYSTYYDVTLEANAGTHVYSKTYSSYILVENYSGGHSHTGGDTGGTVAETPAAETQFILPSAENPATAPGETQHAEANPEFAVDGYQGDMANVVLGDSMHTVMFEEITENSITLLLWSEPVKVKLLTGETKKVDLDGNGSNDVAITLKTIIDGKAYLTFEDLINAPASETAVGETGEPAGDGAGITGAAIGGANKTTFAFIGIAILALVIIAALVTRRARKSEKKSSQ